MTILRTRNGSGTTVREIAEPIEWEGESPSAPSAHSYEGSFCDRGSIPPSVRFYDREKPHKSDLALDERNQDLDDLLLDFDLLDYYYTFKDKKHWKKNKGVHPYVTTEVIYGMGGELLFLTKSYEEAARDEERAFRIIYKDEFKAKAMTTDEFKVWKDKNLNWKDEDDLKPLNQIIWTDGMMDEWRMKPVGERKFKTGYVYNHLIRSDVPRRVEVTEYKPVKVAPQWARDLGIAFDDVEDE